MGRFQMRPCPDARMVVRGRLIRNDKGLDSVANKKGVSHHTTPYPRRCRGLLYPAPQERGSRPRSPQRGVECFCRGERLLALLPRHLLHRARFVIPRIPPSMSFRASPSVISSAARNLRPKTKISQSPPLAFVRGRLLRNDNGLDSVANKEGGSHHTFAHPRRCRGLLYCAPLVRGSKARPPQCGVE